MPGVTCDAPTVAPLASHAPNHGAHSARPSPRVAFQGEHGAYSEDAIDACWGGAAIPVPARTCADVTSMVAAGTADRGMLAVENTLAGSVVAAYDALAAAPTLIVEGEVVLPIRHCVLGLAGATLASIATVESHPVALAQCTRLFATHAHLEARPAYDTAGAARAVAEAGDVRRAALAGRAAARRFGLALLATDVEDRPDNQTRFFVVAPSAGAAPRSGPMDGAPARTVLIATTDNAPGALLHLLAPFAAAGLNLSKLESRPTGTPWTYRFFVEVEHPGGDARVGAALADVARATRALRVLGTFTRTEAGGKSRSAT